MKIHAPCSHPRYLSNYYRDLIVDGIGKGIVAPHGLIAHGRGETFDYLLQEKTYDFAQKAILASAALLSVAKNPIISVNGNTAALVSKELACLSDMLNAPLEINLFHRSKQRERKIFLHLKKMGAKNILMPDKQILPEIKSNRRYINAEGQHIADVVFVPLEDGDRTEALKSLRKKVITVDLNPLSRTAQAATITIVDNIVRCLPLLVSQIKKLKKTSNKQLLKIVDSYNNKQVLNQAEKIIRNSKKL